DFESVPRAGSGLTLGCLQVAGQTSRRETRVTVVDLQFVARASGIAFGVRTQKDPAFAFGAKAKITTQYEISEDSICAQIAAIARICRNGVVCGAPLGTTCAGPAEERFPVEQLDPTALWVQCRRRVVSSQEKRSYEKHYAAQ